LMGLLGDNTYVAVPAILAALLAVGFGAVYFTSGKATKPQKKKPQQKKKKDSANKENAPKEAGDAPNSNSKKKEKKPAAKKPAPKKAVEPKKVVADSSDSDSDDSEREVKQEVKSKANAKKGANAKQQAKGKQTKAEEPKKVEEPKQEAVAEQPKSKKGKGKQQEEEEVWEVVSAKKAARGVNQESRPMEGLALSGNRFDGSAPKKQQPKAEVPYKQPAAGPVPDFAPIAVSDAVKAATAAREKAVAEAEAAAADALIPKGHVSLTIDEKHVGRIVGPKGATLNLIQEKTNTRLDISGNVVTITGANLDGVAEAEAAVRSLCTKGYCAMQYGGDFVETTVPVWPRMLAELIGSGGVIIKKFQENLQVQLDIPAVARNAPNTKKVKVTLAGSKENVQKAKEAVTEILTYYHSELTHPGVVHAEVEVKHHLLNVLIGKGGSEIKHIQKNWNVRLYIPNETSLHENVLIVGEPDPVARAMRYVEKVLVDAETRPANKRSEGYDGDDGWGQEEEVEDWMKAYIYKR